MKNTLPLKGHRIGIMKEAIYRPGAVFMPLQREKPPLAALQKRLDLFPSGLENIPLEAK